MNIICEVEKCTGCKACKNACPKGAIEFITDRYGCTLPSIQADKCVDCSLCRNVCPVCNPVELNVPVACYAAWTKNDEDRKQCSSGGIAAAFSELVIARQGIVYGVAFDENLNLFHQAAASDEDCKKFRTSKYVQSDTGKAYSEIRQQLEQETEVMFIGTPCQVAGLRNYLRKAYSNLYLIDIICHGVPPIAYLHQWIESVNVDRKKISNVTFRGQPDFYLSLYSDDTMVYSKSKVEDLYFYSFMKSLVYRTSCYTCPYAQKKRCSDVTIGDFWGLDRTAMRQQYKGKISVVLVNTEKGQQLFDAIRDDIDCEERRLEEAIEGNPQLRRPSIQHPNRETFLKAFSETGFVEALIKAGIKKEVRILHFKNNKVYQSLRNLKKKLFH